MLSLLRQPAFRSAAGQSRAFVCLATLLCQIILAQYPRPHGGLLLPAFLITSLRTLLPSHSPNHIILEGVMETLSVYEYGGGGSFWEIADRSELRLEDLGLPCALGD